MHIGTDHKLSEENQSMILFWNARHNQLLKPFLKIAKKKRKVIYISNVCGLFKENSCLAIICPKTVLFYIDYRENIKRPLSGRVAVK